MQKHILNINGISTCVATWGCNLHEIPKNPSNYLIFLPGNPGIIDLYIEFLTEIHNKTNKTIWIIGHAGHERFSDDWNYLQENNHGYTLQGQINHKVLRTYIFIILINLINFNFQITFIEKYVPQNVTITLCGYSMGTYISLKILQVPSIKSRITKSYLLFPAIEHLAESRNGFILTNYLRYISFLQSTMVILINSLPAYVENLLIASICKIFNLPADYKRYIKNFLNSYTIRNTMLLARESMVHVRERDTETLKNNLTILKLYYGANDWWAPINYYENLKKDIPEIDAELCDKSIPHVFMLHYSFEVAQIVINWLQC